MPEIRSFPYDRLPANGRMDAGHDSSAIYHQAEEVNTGPKPKRWKLRLRKKPEVEEKDKKKKKKGKKKKVETPLPVEEVEEWELGPTMEEMRKGVVENYYADVRARIRLLLEYRRMTGVRRPVDPEEYMRLVGLLSQDFDDISSFSSILTDSDIAMLPTILEQSRNAQDAKFELSSKSAQTIKSILSQLTTSRGNDFTIKSASSFNTVSSTASPFKRPSLPVSPLKIIQDTNHGSELGSDSDEDDVDDDTVQPSVLKSTRESAVTQERLQSSGIGNPDSTEIDQNDDGESLSDEFIKPSRSYEDNRFSKRITRESVLHYVQNKQSGFNPNKKEVKPAEDELDESVDEAEEEKDDEEEQEIEETLDAVERKALFECVWEGDVDLLDDILDLPGADINITNFGENLLMTAIRARNSDVAAYLINNNINMQAEVPRFERRDDVRQELDMQRAQEQAQEKVVKKKGKKKNKEKVAADMSSIDVLTNRDDALKSPDNASSKLTDMECYMLGCREMALELGSNEIVLMIDAAHGQLWSHQTMEEREVRVRETLQDKLRNQGLYIESDDEQFMEEPEKPVVEESEADIKAKKRQYSSDGQRRPTRDETNLFYHPSRHDSQPPTRQGASHLTTPYQQGASILTTPILPLTSSNLQILEINPPPLPINTSDPAVTGIEALPHELAPTIVHQADLPRLKTKQLYRGSRTFYTRKGSNTKFNEVMDRLSSANETKQPRKLVQSHGSFGAESKAWHHATTVPMSNTLLSKSYGDFESLRMPNKAALYSDTPQHSLIRKVKPLLEHDMVHVMSRQNTIIKSPRDQRPKLNREHTMPTMIRPNPIPGTLRYPVTNLARSLLPIKKPDKFITGAERVCHSLEPASPMRKSAGLGERKAVVNLFTRPVLPPRGRSMHHPAVVTTAPPIAATRVITAQNYHKKSAHWSYNQMDDHRKIGGTVDTRKYGNHLRLAGMV